MKAYLILLFFTGIHAWTDFRDREIHVPVLLAEALAGYSLKNTISPPDFLPGLLLLAAALLSRGAVGLGDCFVLLSGGFFLTVTEHLRILTLMFWEILFWSAAMGKRREEELPMIPFYFLALLLFGRL